MSRYSDEVRQLMTAGKTQVEAERAVRREQPHLRNELLQEAAQRRADQRSRGSRIRSFLPSASTSTAATSTPHADSLLARAVAGEHFTEAVIFAAVKPINKTTSWFRNEVQHRRQNLQDEEQERSAKRSAPPSRSPSRARTDDLVNEHNLSFVLPSVQQAFDSLVAEAAKCEREFSDSEVLAAGHDVATFRDRLASAVLDKVLYREFQVGSVSVDCSGPGGACVCR